MCGSPEIASSTQPLQVEEARLEGKHLRVTSMGHRKRRKSMGVKVPPRPGRFEGAPDGGVCGKRRQGSREQALGCEAGGCPELSRAPKEGTGQKSTRGWRRRKAPSKGNRPQTRRQPPAWEGIRVNHTSEKGLISKTDKELMHSSKRLSTF